MTHTGRAHGQSSDWNLLARVSKTVVTVLLTGCLITSIVSGCSGTTGSTDKPTVR